MSDITPSPTSPSADALRAPKTLLIGGTGTGKTHALRTYLDAGLEVALVATEYPESLLDTPPEKFHWMYCPPAVTPWSTLLTAAKQITAFGNDALQKMPGVEKDKYTQFYNVLGAFANFKCDRCGKVVGDLSKLDLNWATGLDSLSGLSVMAMDLAIGAKPLASQPDWGVAMSNLERLINTFTMSIRTYFVLTAHMEKELDEVAGSTSIMVSTLGRKLAPKIPRFFSDVVNTKRQGTEFSWATEVLNMDLKGRNLPIGATKLQPSFVQIVNAFRSRVAKGQ